MEQYFASKTILFQGSGTEPPRVAIINIEDEYGQRLIKLCKKREELITYGIKRGDFHVQELSIEKQRKRFKLVTPRGRDSDLESDAGTGERVQPACRRGCCVCARSWSPAPWWKLLTSSLRVPGRFERVDVGQPFTVIVDYAHTDDALRNLTAVARDFLAPARRTQAAIITVFGCGGDRDRSKRPLMGEAAGRGSDFVVLTSDNPRSENPLDIMNDALPGLQRTADALHPGAGPSQSHRLAIHEAEAGDIVLIAGKGHERVQVTAAGPVAFDDVEEAKSALRSAGYATVASAQP